MHLTARCSSLTHGSGGIGNGVSVVGFESMWFHAGSGDDSFTGSEGDDILSFGDVSGTARLPGIERVNKLETGDVIDHTGIDAIEGVSGSGFTWIGESDFSGAAGELRVYALGTSLVIAGNTHTDAQAELVIFLTQTASAAEANLLL